MKKYFKNLITILFLVCILFSSVSVTAVADELFSVNVSIVSDNITLANYSLETDEKISVEALGGGRATFLADSHGNVVSITVNGRTLSADDNHTIGFFHNGSEALSYDIVVKDGDSFVFKYTTTHSIVEVSSKDVVSKNIEKVTSKATNSKAIIGTSSKTTKKKNNKDISSADISSEEVSSVESEEISSEESVESEINDITENPNQYEWNDELTQMLDSACSWLTVNDDSIMQLIVLSSAGQPARMNTVERFLQNVKATNGIFDSNKEQFLAVISSAFSGVNAQDVRGVNLVQILADNKDIYLQNPYYAAMLLIALDCDNYLPEDTALREQTIKAIVNLQNEDGGFGFYSDESDVDTTATVLTAISGYKAQVSDTITDAINYLANQLEKNNGLSGVQIAKTIVAINSLGLSMTDERFYIDGKNLVEIIETYINKDGGFKNTVSGSSHAEATEYFVLALVSIKKGMSPYTINYQSQHIQLSTDEQTQSNVNYIIFITLSVVFVIIVLIMILGFFYNKNRVLKSEDETLKIYFDED